MASSRNTFLFSLFIPLFFLCFSGIATTTFSTQPLNLTNFNFLGAAHILDNTFKLTGDFTVPNSGAGRVLYNKPIRFRLPDNPNPTSFTTHFTFSINTLNPNSVGGGLAFVISPDDISVGAAGGFLGIPANSVSVEFDTVKDVEFKDFDGNHLGVDIGSVVSLHTVSLDSVDIDLKSGDLIHSWVDYSGSYHQLKVFISLHNIKPDSPALSVAINLHEYVNDFMFVGFSGSTQGSTEVHSVEFWSFSSTFDDPSQKIGSNSPPPMSSPLPAISNFMSPFNPVSYLMPPTISTIQTTRKYRNLNKLIRGLAGALVGTFVTAGGISFYLKYQNGDKNQYYNICNFCSNVNNVAV